MTWRDSPRRDAGGRTIEALDICLGRRTVVREYAVWKAVNTGDI